MKQDTHFFLKINKQLGFFIFIFFNVFISKGQTTVQDYINLEQIRIVKADSINLEVNNYIQNNINSYNLSSQRITDITNNLLIEHDASDNPIIGSDLQAVLLQVKQNDLRNLYFSTHSTALLFFTATVKPQSLRIECINGGFENGNVAEYTLRSIVVAPSTHLNDFCSVDNSSENLDSFNFTPSTSFDQYQDKATIVSFGSEPFLNGLGININQVHTGGFALKLNPNPNSAATLQIGNVTSVYRDFTINANTIDFSYLHFGYVVPPGHNQPFFRYRLYSVDALDNITGTLRDVCIPMNINNCRYNQVADNRYGANTLSYTPNWVCQEINTANLMGQRVRLEFTVSDCQFRGHFSTVYIDDLCGVTCPPTWGAIHLNNTNITCPRNPFTVCGNFQLPGTATIGSMVLNVLNPSGTIIGTISNPTITGQNFCFTVNPTIFGVNPLGNYSFQVIANLNNSPCVPTLIDSLGIVSFTANVTPTFSSFTSSYCQNAMPNALPSTSSNGIVGTWSPSSISTSVVGNQTYTFTPTDGVCATKTTITITVNPIPNAGILSGTQTVCEGNTITFSSTVTGGIWTTSNSVVATVNSSGLVTGNIAGTSTITYTVTANGCTGTATRTISVNAKPILGGATNVCVGSTANVTPTTGGTWVSSSTTLATVTNTGVITGVAAGIVTLTFTNTSTGCFVAKSITVNAKPVLAGATKVCVGNTANVTPATGGTWASSNTALATVTNTGLISGIAAGTVTLTFTNTTTGCSLSKSIKVNAITILGGATSVCVGSTTTVTPITAGTWASSNVSVATITNTGIVTGISAGIVTLTYTNTSTVCSTTKTITVNANPNAGILSGLQTICLGNTLTFSSTVAGGAWSSSNTAIATINAANGAITPVAAGTATMSYTVTSNGCTGTATRTITINASPSISSILPTTQTLCVGNTPQSLQVTVSGVGLSYQWYSNTTNTSSSGTIISGATTFSYTPPTSVASTKYYYVVITSSNGCTSVTSSPVMVKVNSNIIPQFIDLSENTFCQGNDAPLLPAISDNGISGTWSTSTVSNINSGNYLFTPTGGQCAIPKNFSFVVIPNGAFIVNDDYFTSTYPSSTVTTASVINNDQYNGNNLNNVLMPNGVSYFVELISSPPTFSSGGIIMDSHGAFSILPNTPAGTYTFQYILQSTCSTVGPATVIIVVPGYIESSKLAFSLCYSSTSSSQSTTGFSSLFDTTTIGGLPANSSNSYIVINPPLPSGFSLNTNGTISIAPNTPSTGFSINFKVCSLSGSICGNWMACDMNLYPSITGYPDFVTYDTTGNLISPVGQTIYNVLSNDFVLGCPDTTIPATLNAPANVVFTPSANNQSYFSLDPLTGNINTLGFPPIGQYILTYQVCNITTAHCATISVNIMVQAPLPFATTNTSSTNLKKFESKPLLITKNGLQIINFPDAVLKQRLLTFGYCKNVSLTSYIQVDTNSDGEIDTNEALAVGGFSANGSSVSDLTGLIYFLNLKELWIGSTQVLSINNNLLPNSLTFFAPFNIPILSLDTSYFPNLTNLVCMGTQITNLDLGANHNLQYLNIQNMPNLTSLNIKNNSTLDYSYSFMTDFCWTGCPNLTTICTDASELPALQNYLANCGINTNGMVINSSCNMGVDENELLDGISILPNPSSGFFEVSFVNGIAEKTKLSVINMLGQEIQCIEYTINDKIIKIDLSNHPSGVYLVKIESNNVVLKKTIIKN
jgi:Secretion system C-terminal sorting domain/Ig-like domain CHU_C associated/Bacterial Ig-like domain (group 2)